MWPLGQEKRRKENSCWSHIPGRTGTIGVYPFCEFHVCINGSNGSMKQKSLLSSPVTVVYSQQNYCLLYMMSGIHLRIASPPTYCLLYILCGQFLESDYGFDFSQCPLCFLLICHIRFIFKMRVYIARIAI